MDTSDDTLPAPPLPVFGDPAGTLAAERRRRRRWWIGGTVLGLLVAALAASFLVELPYYALRPGTVRPTEASIVVEGAETFASDGEISFTTVSVRRMTVYDAARAWLDDDTEILSEEELLGPRTAEENRQFNLQLMDTSKQDAVRVALLHLGYDVPVSVTGETVVRVSEGTPADGVMEVGDTIVSINGTELTQAADLFDILLETRPGDTVELGVERPNGETIDVSLVLAERPDDAEHGFIGVDLQPRGLVYDFPIDVTIDSANVGGPSAGLAFTLAVLDALTPGDLTGGKDVAVTGTIGADGTVGRVGGVVQKAAAVRDAGIPMFLVPPGEGDAARDKAGPSVRVIEVGTLEEALEALDSLGGNALDLGTPGSGEEALVGN